MTLTDGTKFDPVGLHRDRALRAWYRPLRRCCREAEPPSSRQGARPGPLPSVRRPAPTPGGGPALHPDRSATCTRRRRPLLRLPAGDQDRLRRRCSASRRCPLEPSNTGIDLTRPLHPRDRGHRGGRRSLRSCSRRDPRGPGAVGQTPRIPPRRGDQLVRPPARRHRSVRHRGQGAHPPWCARRQPVDRSDRGASTLAEDTATGILLALHDLGVRLGDR